MSTWGFVYCMANEAMPNLYKIGYTTKTPMARAEELSSSSGVPEPFEVLFYLETKNPAQVEAKIHHYLKQFRVNPSREFFKMPDCMILRAMQELGDGEGSLMESHAYQGLVQERKFLREKAEQQILLASIGS